MSTNKQERELLSLLNLFLAHNSKAKRSQKVFESKLKEYLKQENLSEVMDWYIDLDISGKKYATQKDIDIIINQARSGYE